MIDQLESGTLYVALALVVLLPLFVLGIGELEERLRQSDSPYRSVASVIRNWVVPATALWVMVAALFDADTDSFVPRVIATVAVCALTVAALAMVRVAVDRLRDRPRVDRRGAVPQLLLVLPRLFVLLVAAFFLVDTVWGVDLSAALTALGVTSLVASFALQDTLSGLASGFLLLADQPFQPGDWVRVGDVEGRVEDVNWRSSRIIDRDGDLLVIPNSEVANALVVNYDRPTRLHRIVFPVQVAFVNSPTSAEEMLLAAAQATPNVLDEPPPAVRVVQVDDPLMGYEVHVWVDDYAKVPAVRSDLGGRIWYLSHRQEVPLPSPAYDIFLHDTAVAAAPDEARQLAELLRGSALLSQLDAGELERLVTGARKLLFARGETIATGGRAPVVLVSGQARLVLDSDRGERVVAELEQGELLGLIEQPGTRIVATTDCSVLMLEEQVAAVVTSRNPGLGRAIEQLSGSRKRRIDRILAEGSEVSGA